MRAFSILLALIALATTASAFFPWYPDYRCATTHDCVEVKNSDEGVIVGRGGGMTMKVTQRVPKHDESPINRIRHLAERLRNKYERGTPTKEMGQRGVVKRTNTYSIMAAATPSQASSAGIDQDGTDYSYFAQVQLGSADTSVYMLLDTGADSSWVMGSTCTSGPCTIHNLYNPTTSTTYKGLGQAFGVQYGSGSVSGVTGTDDLTIAGLKIPITLGIVNMTSNDFNNFPMDGILGLSLGESGGNPSFIDSLKSSKALKYNIFGMSLNRASDGPNTGEINFGAADTSRYTGDLSYTAVSSSGGGFWAIPMANVGLGTTQAGITTKLAYIDTGTSFIFCSPDDAKTFHAVVPGATTSDGTTWHVPCGTTASVTFTFGSTSYSVSPKDWVSAPNSGVCTSNIYGHDIVSGNWLLGDTFLKNVYAVFDADQSRVGFGQKVVSTLSSTTAATSATSASITTGTVATGTGATFTASTLVSATSSSGATPTTGSGSPGLNGHETSNSNSGTAVAQTTAAEASPTAAKSSGLRLRSGVSAACFCLLLTLII